MLAQMTREQFEERWAHHLMSLGDQWQIGAMIAAMIHNTMQTYMAAKAGKHQVPRSALIEPEALIPRPPWYERAARPPRPGSGDPETLARALGCI